VVWFIEILVFLQLLLCCHLVHWRSICPCQAIHLSSLVSQGRSHCTFYPTNLRPPFILCRPICFCL